LVINKTEAFDKSKQTSALMNEAIKAPNIKGITLTTDDNGK
jgi:hypothetical protein